MRDARNDWRRLFDRWRGRTVACIASGPSMTQADADIVRASGIPTIAINTAFRLAPWADIVYSNDEDWYAVHMAEIRRTVSAGTELWCGHPDAPRMDLLHIPFDKKARGVTMALDRITWGGNSGFAGMQIAHKCGAGKIIICGYDQQWTDSNGKPIPHDKEAAAKDIVRHFHGDHPRGLKQDNNWPFWRDHFQDAARDFYRLHVEVVNCSRSTSLTMFKRSTLEAELCR